MNPVNVNHNLIHNLPNDASFQIIRFLDYKSLRVLSVVSLAFRTFIEQQQESLYNQAARETLRTYHHIIGLFGSLQGYRCGNRASSAKTCLYRLGRKGRIAFLQSRHSQSKKCRWENSRSGVKEPGGYRQSVQGSDHRSQNRFY